MISARSAGAFVAFSVIAILTGIDMVGDLQRDGFLFTWNIGLDFAAMLAAAASAAYCAVQFVRERRMHEEILHDVLASLPEDD